MRIAFGKPPRPIDLNEAQVTKQIKDYLAWRGWRAVRFQRTLVQLPGGGAFSTGEPGQADFQFIKYIDCGMPGVAAVLWIEMKAPGKKASCSCDKNAGTNRRCTLHDQMTWKKRERDRGAIVWTVDSLDWFVAEYNRVFGYLHRGDLASGQLQL